MIVRPGCAGSTASWIFARVKMDDILSALANTFVMRSIMFVNASPLALLSSICLGDKDLPAPGIGLGAPVIPACGGGAGAAGVDGAGVASFNARIANARSLF